MDKYIKTIGTSYFLTVLLKVNKVTVVMIPYIIVDDCLLSSLASF